MRTQQPLVCICIPNYNNENTISETLDSLVNQTYKNIIIKIFDNASTDSSMTILKGYQAKYNNIHLFQNETNIGGEANFTKCIENMEGEFGAVFHADDIYSPTMIQEQVEFLQNQQECSAVATHAHTINSHSKITGERLLPNEFKKTASHIFDNEVELLKIILKFGNIITCPSVMARTEIYKNQIQQWNGTDYKTSADLDVWLRLAQFGKFGFITKPLMNYRVSEASYSYNLARMRIYEDDIFLVLNSWAGKRAIWSFLAQEDKDNYDFLIFKDNIFRMINEFIQGKKTSLPLYVFSWKILKIGLRSKKKIKIYLAGIFIAFLQPFPKVNALRKLLYYVRFGK